MKISIAMATYNGEKYLREQLDSFLFQTHQPDELIITDDCSSDETEQIVLEFIERATFEVKYYRNNTCLGYCGNFNKALLQTTGDLVFLSDQDDVWFPNKIEYIIKLAESNPRSLAFMNNAELTDANLIPVGLTKLGQITSARRGSESFVMGCCCAVRRKLLDLSLPIPGEFKAHDNWLIGFADALNSRIIDRESLQYYRRHSSNESHFIANRLEKIGRLDLLKEYLTKVFRKNDLKEHKKRINQSSLFLMGLKNVCEKGVIEESLSLRKSIKSLERKIKLERRRLYIRSRPLVCRFKLAFSNLLSGGYKEANGISSALKDIYG